MAYYFSKDKASLRIVHEKIPSITGATRLETLPTSIGMLTGLQAPLGDPLWMLSRQWQFNEFQGEDAGTPLRIRFNVRGTAIDAFRSGADDQGQWTSLDDVQAGARGVPIETRVEAEAVWRGHPRLCGEAGMYALRMASDSVRAKLLAAYPLGLEQPSDPDADQAGLLWSVLFNHRTIDTIELARDLRQLKGAGNESDVPARLNLDPADDPGACRAMLERWLAWLDALVFEGDGARPDATNPSWQRNRMEYAFSLRAGDVALRADEYTDGHLDWDDFRASAPDQPVERIEQVFSVAARHPSPVRYPGMPAERYWEFEDGNVNFAGAEAGITDLLRMCVTEFALTFGNDWFVVPVRLPVGWLYQVNDFVITDSFGIASSANAIEKPDGMQWTMYSLTADANLQGRVQHAMLLPDSLDGVQEGAVLEETLLARDEMANLAWAIEKKVQGVSGEPLDRDLEARALAFQQQIALDKQPDSPQLIYRLATPVPANWTPLLPVRDPALNLNDPLAIRLARAGMKRFYPDATVEVMGGDVDPHYADFLALLDKQTHFITKLPVADGLRTYVFYPRGWLLRRDPDRPIDPLDPEDKLVIEEEEVPRIGATLKRKFQYARSSDGRSWLWIGRSKIAGRGEAASHLRFDVAVKKMR